MTNVTTAVIAESRTEPANENDETTRSVVLERPARHRPNRYERFPLARRLPTHRLQQRRVKPYFTLPGPANLNRDAFAE